jgi:hypothetical protein
MINERGCHICRPISTKVGVFATHSSPLAVQISRWPAPLAFGTAVDATSLNRDAPMTRMPNRSGREKDRDFDLPQQRLLDSFQSILPGCLARVSCRGVLGSVWNHFKTRFFLLHPAVV